MNTKLLYIIKELSKSTYPCKKALQKTIYLIQKKGVNLGFDYSIHYYGPYSSKLDNSLYSLVMTGMLDIDKSSRGHTIRLIDEEIIDNVFLQEEKEKIKEVLDAFPIQSAFELEVITTTDFVANNTSDNDENIILEEVKAIKGEKFTDEKIKNAVSVLKEQGYWKKETVSSC